MKSKKGMELAINTIVVMILGIVLLGMGITFVVKFVGKSTEIYDEVDERLQREIERLYFADGKRVAILNPHAIINRGKVAVFTLGVVNTFDTPIDIRVYTAYNDESPVDAAFKEWLLLNTNAYKNPNAYLVHAHTYVPSKPPEQLKKTLQPNERFFTYLIFDPPRSMPSGEYLYDVFVCYQGTPSGRQTDNANNPIGCGVTYISWRTSPTASINYNIVNTNTRDLNDLYADTRQRLFITLR